MGSSRTTFEKLQRDRAKKAKADAKRAKRLARSQGLPTDVVEEPPEEGPVVSKTEGEISPDELLRMVDTLHKRFESNAISFEEFEAEKVELLARLGS